jgi:hypothetical protein
MRSALLCITLTSLVVTGCSRSSEKKASTTPSGEKAIIGPLAYSVVDTEIIPQLGEDPASARTPEHRFYLVKVSVSNSGSTDVPIPGMTLVDDAGQSYPELADGKNVPTWLGVVRKAESAKTELGNVVFDAPAKHYRMKLTDDLDEKDVFIDIPLNFVHEQMKDLQTVPNASEDLPKR